MAEEVTKIVENIDKLFSEIVVNGESHTSDRYVPPEPAQANPPVEQEEEEQTPSTPQRDVQGEYVDTIYLNNTLHDLKDSPLTQEVLAIQQAINTLQGRLNDLVASVGNINAKIPAQASSTNQLADKDFVNSGLNSINAKIPAQASSTNQLADKDFVNSSISTNTANFLGTYSTLAEIEAIPNPTNNDYAFLETADSSGNNLYDRYKYSAEDGEWLFEYELNNSSFTAEQWATINSGITEVSDTVQSGDSDPVSSDAVYQALQNVTITAVDVIEENNMNAVTSNAVYVGLSSKLGGKFLNDYYGITAPNGADNVWIRTTSQGIIPYQSGGRTSGHCYLGTSSWYFGYGYVQNMYVNKLNLSTSAGTENGDIWIA